MDKRFHNIEKKILINILITTSLLSSFLVFPASAQSSWSRARPSDAIDKVEYNERIGNQIIDSQASLGIGVDIYQYVRGSDDSDDFLQFRVSASANTRKGIQYDVSPWDYKWYSVSKPTNIVADNHWAVLSLPFIFLFYGVEYSQVYVSDDGLLSFDPQQLSPPVDPPPQGIPSTLKPNSLIAPFWRDLDPGMGGSITYDTVVDGAFTYFVVSWNNVPNKDNHVAQTFQVALKAEAGGSVFHNKIFFRYKDITKDCYTSVGVEDQVGNKGTSYDFNNLYNGLGLEFEYGIAGYRLEKLKITLTKSDSLAKIDIQETYLGGYNVLLSEYTNPYADYFKSAIGFAAGILLPEAGIIWETLVILDETAQLLSGDLSKPDLTPHDALEGDNEAYFTGMCRDELRLSMKTFDSTLASDVIWYFLDDSPYVNHDLSIKAELIYQDISSGNYIPISTPPVSLNMHTGGEVNFDTHVLGGSEITNVKVWIDDNQFYSPVTLGVNSGNHTLALDHVFYRGVYKFTFRAWEDGSTENPRIVNVESAVFVAGYYEVTYMGTCPTLFVWNGSQYVYETLLNIHGDSDITLQHIIEQPLVPEKQSYKLSLRELDEFTSHIDYFKLYVVDSEDGEMYETHLTQAIHSKLGDVKELLLHDDDLRIDLTPTQTIDLKFTVPNIEEVAYFIIEINGHNKKIV